MTKFFLINLIKWFIFRKRKGKFTEILSVYLKSKLFVYLKKNSYICT